MIEQPRKTRLRVPKDIAIDYALLAIGTATGLIGLVCLLLV
ncbi:hypothetical protein [Rhodopseudomonas sp. NSM]